MSYFGNDTITVNIDDSHVELNYKDVVDLLNKCFTVSNWHTLRVLAAEMSSVLSHIVANRHLERVLITIDATTLQQITTITSDMLAFQEKASEEIRTDIILNRAYTVEQYNMFGSIHWGRTERPLEWKSVAKVIRRASEVNFNRFINCITQFTSGISFSQLPRLVGISPQLFKRNFAETIGLLTRLRLYSYEQHDALLEKDIKKTIESRTHEILGKRRPVDVGVVSRRNLPIR